MSKIIKKENWVLLPGWTRSFRTYRDFFGACPKNINLEFIDYGKIIPNGKVEDFAGKLVGYLGSKGIKDFTLVGFSLGGALAFEVALKYPKLVKKLYLVNAAGIYGKETPFQVLKNQTMNLLERKGSKMFRSVRNSNLFTSNLFLNIKLGIYAHKIDLRGRRVRGSFPQTVVFWGDRDVVHPLWQGEEFKKLIPRSKLIKIKDGGHDWLVYEPEKFWNQVD